MSTKVRILLYHRVGVLDGSFMDEYTVSPEAFSEQMDWLARHTWRPVTLDDAFANPLRRTKKRSFVLTFDDGFASNRQYAWPVLERYGFPSATFIVTGCMGGSNIWDGPSRAYYPLLSKEDIETANAELMSFHSHSVTHADLTFLTGNTDILRWELTQSQVFVASLKTPGGFFAYPRGSWNWTVMEAVRAAGYKGACTSLDGLNSACTHPFLLRRTEIREQDRGWRLSIKLHTGRDIVRWPPNRPPEVSIAAAWLRKRRVWSVRAEEANST